MSHTYAKGLSFLFLHYIHFENSFLVGKCLLKKACTLPSDIFKMSAISLFGFPKRFGCLFYGYRCIHLNEPSRAFSIVSVCTGTFKISKSLLHRLLRWGRVQMTFIKQCFGCDSTFTHQNSD
uniref:Putative product n=1 Tax=Xenopsylla cheopis TaxID=163159 RepID=A0A6M2DJ48_XENCH